LHDPQLPEVIRLLLQSWQQQPRLLTFEITESALMADPATALKVLARISKIGCRLSLDDFGTGYSSLVTLRTLPAAEIKIDQSFVRGMMARPADRIIVTATRELGHSLGMRVAAEGVESEAIWRCLAEIGCDTAQGYHLGRPAEARALAPRLRRGAPRRDAS
jgi:EAL domain-containing protein (putative c-di-GMP-specific phosphodiesterase class I)